MIHQTVFLFLIFLPSILALRTCPPVTECLRELDAGRECPLLPVPTANLQPPLPAEGYVVVKQRPGVFTYTDGVYVSVVIYRMRRLVVIDAPRSASSVAADGQYLLNEAIDEILNGRNVTRLSFIYSHRHIDHIGNAGLVKNYLEDKFPALKGTVKVYGTEETREFLKRAGTSNTVPLPNRIVGEATAEVTVSENVKLTLNTFSGHTRADILTHLLPSADGPGLVHIADYFTVGGAPFFDFGLTEDFGSYIKTHSEILKLDFDVYSAGHGVGTKFDVQRNLRYTRFVLRAAQTAGAEVPPEKFAEINRLVADPTAVQFQNGAFALSASIRLLTDVCVRNVIERWGCVLTGTDIYVESHCQEAVLFGIVDTQ